MASRIRNQISDKDEGLSEDMVKIMEKSVNLEHNKNLYDLVNGMAGDKGVHPHHSWQPGTDVDPTPGE
ncbi:hypothetical protein LguiA_018908 [Lonicera macranthoides]